jgi:hypothetical protein
MFDLHSAANILDNPSFRRTDGDEWGEPPMSAPASVQQSVKFYCGATQLTKPFWQLRRPTIFFESGG